ncbi:HepT-like ribonuclease domain-containing protein [Methanobrevibacter sp.]
MKNNDILYIQKIIEYCDIVDSLLEEYERDYVVFQSSKSFQLSTSMCIVQIGEYVSRLSDGFKQEHDNIPWRQIKGMRNFAAHQ